MHLLLRQKKIKHRTSLLKNVTIDMMEDSKLDLLSKAVLGFVMAPDPYNVKSEEAQT